MILQVLFYTALDITDWKMMDWFCVIVFIFALDLNNPNIPSSRLQKEKKRENSFACDEYCIKINVNTIVTGS